MQLLSAFRTRFGWSALSGSWLQFPDVLDDLVDLRLAERRAERGHRTRLAVFDAITDKVVVSFCIHKLRPFPGCAAAIGVTPSTRDCEQLVDIDWRVVLRDGSRLRLSQAWRRSTS